jgi:hypothetical protein
MIVPKSNEKTFTKLKNKGDDRKHKTAEQASSRDELVAPLSWPQRLRRVFNIDVTVCPLCGGTLRIIAGGCLGTSPILS